jgi:hypothetical protein
MPPDLGPERWGGRCIRKLSLDRPKPPVAAAPGRSISGRSENK